MVKRISINKIALKVRKSDMYDMDIFNCRYNYMGLFTSDEAWKHPKACEVTYEIIYVTAGCVYLAEEDRRFVLQKGDLAVLSPGIIHYGNIASENVSFYWLHYNSDAEYDSFTIHNFSSSYLFKQLMHYSHMPNCPEYVKNAVLHHLLAEISMCEINRNISSLGSSIYEWTRVNISRSLTVEKVANHFRYNSEYISRLIKKQYGITLKSLIDKMLIDKAKEYLCNVNMSVKEISSILGFSNANAFIIFFKYHEKITPKSYRNSYSYIHMNIK